MILHFLALRRMCAEQRAAGENQVQTLGIIFLADEEIFLFCANGGGHALDVLAKQLQHTAGFPADGIHGAQQRGLLIKNLTRVGAECRGDAQRVVLNESIGGRVPSRVAARLKSGTQTAGGEGRSVRLALGELLAGEFHDDGTIALR